MIKRIAVVIAALGLLVGVSACEMEESQPDQYKQVEKTAKKGKTYIPKNGVEKSNYERAQKLYDSPDNIIWCTSSFPNPSAPLFTVPIAGKLTSSSVSYFANKTVKTYGSNDAAAEVELRSVDGMYHGSPGPYRYGFTPGGQYVDFTNMEVFCTTALTSFQREKTEVSVTFDTEAKGAQKTAQDALKSGDPKAAQDALKGLESK